MPFYHAEILNVMKSIENEIDQFAMLREKLAEKSFLNEKIEMISGEGVFAKIEYNFYQLIGHFRN